MISKLATMVAVLSFSDIAIADEPIESCFDTAMTQLSMNGCASMNRQAARSELERVLEKIRNNYPEQSTFLTKLDASQKAWEALLAANLEMKFPSEERQILYGSVYPMCIGTIEASEIFKRLEFLAQWVIGTKEGDVCSGSVIPTRFLLVPVTEERN